MLKAILDKVAALLAKLDLEMVAQEFANRLPQEYRTILSQRHSPTPMNAKQNKQPVENGAPLKHFYEAGYSRLLVELSLLDATCNCYSRDRAE